MYIAVVMRKTLINVLIQTHIIAILIVELVLFAQQQVLPRLLKLQLRKDRTVLQHQGTLVSIIPLCRFITICYLQLYMSSYVNGKSNCYFLYSR
jgi:hypothetical protein